MLNDYRGVSRLARIAQRMVRLNRGWRRNLAALLGVSILGVIFLTLATLRGPFVAVFDYADIGGLKRDAPGTEISAGASNSRSDLVMCTTSGQRLASLFDGLQPTEAGIAGVKLLREPGRSLERLWPESGFQGRSCESPASGVTGVWISAWSALAEVENLFVPVVQASGCCGHYTFFAYFPCGFECSRWFAYSNPFAAFYWDGFRTNSNSCGGGSCPTDDWCVNSCGQYCC